MSALIILVPFLGFGLAWWLVRAAAKNFTVLNAWWQGIFSDPLALFLRLPVGPLARVSTADVRLAALCFIIGFKPERVLAISLRVKEILLWTGFLLTIILVQFNPLSKALPLGFIFFAFALRAPELYLARLAERSRRRAERELAPAIDQLRLKVLAGSNLEHAVASVADTVSGFWRPVFFRISERLTAGLSLEEALTGVGVEDMVPDFGNFATALRQARRLGVSLSGALALQSELLRSRRQQRAEAKARTAAVKISLPLVLCIFPALLIIYLAPAVIRIMIDF